MKSLVFCVACVSSIAIHPITCLAQDKETCDTVLDCAKLSVKIALDVKSALKSVQEQLAKQQTELLRRLPSGAVIAFDLNACPEGWSDYQLAYGRFIRGIDKQGGQDPDGMRPPGGVQGDAFQGHWHNIYTDAPGNQAIGLWGGSASGINLFTRSSQMNGTAVEAGTDG